MAEQPYRENEARPLPTWAEARRRLEEAGTYWLATVRPDGRSHVMPVLAVWLDGALHVVAGDASRKARNLARDAHRVITTSSQALDLVLEGDATLHRVAGIYAAKYGWHVTVRDGAFYAAGAPTTGPPPYDLDKVTSTVVFGFGTDDSLGAVRWRF
ncbi:MAG: pyridoxamine 5'-phosphate oxidase family protein [Thermomicrobiales bacterium]